MSAKLEHPFEEVEPPELRPKVAHQIAALLGPPHWGYYCVGFNPANKPSGYIKFAFHCKECESEFDSHSHYMALNFAHQKNFLIFSEKIR